MGLCRIPAGVSGPSPHGSQILTWGTLLAHLAPPSPTRLFRPDPLDRFGMILVAGPVRRIFGGL